MTQFSAKFEKQKNRLSHQLDVATARLKLSIIHIGPDNKLTLSPESEMSERCRAEYQQAYDAYNDFLDVAITAAIGRESLNSCVLN